MRRTARTSALGDTDRAARIELIVGDVIRQRSAGIDLDDSTIQRQHPELGPELGRRLAVLRDIEAAARRVRESPSSGARPGDENCPFEEGLLFLRRTLTNYDILEQVNYGGQGVVYRAIQRATHRPVAIKVLLDGPLASERQSRRLAREAELISRLQHPNIVTLYESGVVRGRPYFAMEYVEGVPIDDHVLLHGLSIADTVRLFTTVVRAVSHAHQQGIIHRDLNPNNVLVDLDGVPRILDFGLAKDVWADDAVREQSSLTDPGQVLGTFPYLSPEQVGARGGRVDVRSDIYSLGVVLFELLTSGFPYPVDADPEAVRADIVAREPLRLRKALSRACVTRTRCQDSILGDLEMILLKALSKDKTHRYQSAAAFADDLARCLAGDAVEARAESRSYLLQRAFRKHRAAVAVAAMFLLILSASTVAVTTMWLRARTQRDTARSMARLAVGTLGDVITKVEESIRPLAGGTAVRDQLLNDVVAGRLRDLRPLVESDAAMEDLQAALYEKQGDIAYACGSFAEAAQSYQAFLDSTSRGARIAPSTDEHVQDMARAHCKLARLGKGADQHFARAIELGELLVHGHPRESEPEYALCATRVEFGRYLCLAGQYERAAQQIDAALETAASMTESHAGGDRWTAVLAQAYQWDGDTRIALGEGWRAIDSLEAALRLHRTLSEAKPADADRRHQVLVTCVKLGSALRDDGRVDRAETVLQEAVSVGQYLTNVDGTVAVWKRDLFGAHQRLAQMYLAEHMLRKGQPHCDAAVDLAQDLVRREPSDVTWRASLAYSYALRGEMFMKMNEPWRAYDDFEMAKNIREKLCAENPNEPALKERLAASHIWLGRCCSKLDCPQEALEEYRVAYDFAQALTAAQPTVAQRAVDCVQSQIRLAVCYTQFDTREDDESAAGMFDEAAASLDHLRDSGKLSRRSGIYESWVTVVEEARVLLAERAQQRTQPQATSSSALQP